MDELPEEFSIQDPFAHGEENLFINVPIRAVQANIYGNISHEDVILKTIKIFAARELRPRLFNWFEDLSKDYGENMEQMTKIPLKIQQVLESILISTNASEKLVARVKKAVPISLFGASEHDFLPQTIIFLANHFQAFRKTSLFEKTDLFNVVGKCEPTDWPEEQNEAVYKYFVKMVEVMFDSWLGFGPLVSHGMSIAYTMVSKVFQTQIYQWHGTFTVENLQEIDNTIRSWLSTFAPQSDETERILQRSHESICCLAIGMLMPNVYDLAILNYPDSSETIGTLRFCFAHTHNYGREATLNLMLDKVRKQLLSVEEDTSVILDGFANCVHSLRELDPSCSFMHRVCSEIREFLKKRPDTVRKIINYITSEKREQLSEQLGTRSGTIIDEDEFRGTNDEFLAEGLDTNGWETWIPDPPDAPVGKSSHVRQSADVFNMLISVYGSKEMFVKEYRKLLSERLTSFAEQDSIFEQRYLEILKQRFNEGELSQCEVMLRDVIESARIEKCMAMKQVLPVTSSIVSSHFWPLPELDKNLVFPDQLEEMLELYTKLYRENKASRRLNWLKSWGWAEVELTIGGTTVTRFVSNQHAAVLYLFAEQESWSPPDVATRLGITKGVARRRLEWWGNQGLLIQELPTGATSEEWRLVEDGTSLENTIRHAGDASDDEDGAAIEDVSDAADALEAYWMYTRNYIAQNETVKAERIHKIFKMFASPSSQGPSLDVVNTFLFRKVKQNLLSFQSGGFRVVKDAPATS